MRKRYGGPTTASEPSFETGALACAKTSPPPPGSWRLYSAYGTFTGHFGGAMGWSFSGQVGLGWGPGGTSLSYS